MEAIVCLNNCGRILERRCMSTHVLKICPRRKVNCQYCLEGGEYQFIKGQHKSTCSMLPIPCPNKCEIGNIPRGEVGEHISICPLQIIQCKYHIVGCKAVMSRKDQKKHDKEMMEEHLSLSVTEISTSHNNAQKTIHDLTQQLATANKEITALKQQLESSQQSLDMIVWKWSTYLDTEAAMLLSGIELLPVIIKLSNFTEMKQRNDTWLSKPFYTHSNGYKMQLVVLPNDVNNSDTHMAVCLRLLHGPFDEELLWPMRGEFEVELLNQSSNSMHYSVICSITNLESSKITTHKFGYICHELLTATNAYIFLKHDNIYFQVQVCKPLQ